MYEAIKVEKKDGICTLVLARPEKRNALTGPMRKEIIEALGALAEDNEVKVVVLAGEGKSFCAGRDVEEVKGMAAAPIGEVFADYMEAKALTDALHNFPKPIIGAVNGHAMGMGCCITTFCDLVVAGETATFGYPEMKLGIVPGISSVILNRTVNRRLLSEMILLANKYSAEKALEMGLINKVVPDNEVLPQAMEWAKQLAVHDTTMLILSKKFLTGLGEGSYEEEAFNSLTLMGVGFVNKNKR